MPDVVIVGAGCMGVATAYNLAEASPSLSVAVVEKDPTLQFSSTLLSEGNVRIQFNLEENILMSQYGMEVLSSFEDRLATGEFRPDPKMRREGNLFTVDSSGVAAARAGMERQLSFGCEVEWWEAAQIFDRYPALTSDRIVGATFGVNDGTVDPGAVTEGYRRAALARGVEFVTAEATSLFTRGDRIGGVRTSSGEVWEADTVVVCAGAWAPQLLHTVGASIPVVPTMRTAYVIATDVATDLPCVFLPSGVYLIPEGPGRFVSAWSLPEDPIGYDFTPADRSRYYDVVWPELVDWLPRFDRLEVVRSWAGLYEHNTLDANGIIGEWPGIDGLFQATGFSGHGFQQCHAVGRYLGEQILGLEPFIDLSRLGPERILSGRAMPEHAGRII